MTDDRVLCSLLTVALNFAGSECRSTLQAISAFAQAFRHQAHVRPRGFGIVICQDARAFFAALCGCASAKSRILDNHARHGITRVRNVGADAVPSPYWDCQAAKPAEQPLPQRFQAVASFNIFNSGQPRIPDSGTTLINGPREQVLQLYEDCFVETCAARGIIRWTGMLSQSMTAACKRGITRCPSPSVSLERFLGQEICRSWPRCMEAQVALEQACPSLKGERCASC